MATDFLVATAKTGRSVVPKRLGRFTLEPLGDRIWHLREPIKATHDLVVVAGEEANQAILVDESMNRAMLGCKRINDRG